MYFYYSLHIYMLLSDRGLLRKFAACVSFTGVIRVLVLKFGNNFLDSILWPTFKLSEHRMARLFFDSCDTVALAQKYGTPLYLMSERMIRERMRDIKSE